MHRVRRSVALVFAAALAVAIVPAAASAAATTGQAGGARAPASVSGWGTAEEVPGTAALNKGVNATVYSVSCASPGNCSAGGEYQASVQPGHNQAFVVNEVNGRWHKAEEVPGTAVLNTGSAEVDSVSCASPGNCSAGGEYESAGFKSQVFVVSEVNGIWQKAEEVPGTAALNKGGGAFIESVSCASAGNCSAGGGYNTVSFAIQAFVVSEVNGIWQNAEEVPGTAALNTGGDAYVQSMSCISAGNCSAGGPYDEKGLQAFVVSETNGIWQSAEEVPGTAALNLGNLAGTQSVSCVSAGNCTAGGSYTDGFGEEQPFVVGETSGTWQKAKGVPGVTTFSHYQGAGISSVSCVSAGNCTAGGGYSVGSNETQAFVVSEIKGVWQKAENVPGLVFLNGGLYANIKSVSCASAGNCSAGGYYGAGNGVQQAFVVDEINGTWQKAEEVPGSAALNKGGNAEINSVSCATATSCGAGGSYQPDNNTIHSQAFVVSRT